MQPNGDGGEGRRGASARKQLAGKLSNAKAVEAADASADAALLASGEELRTLAELARELGVTKADLLGVVAPLASVRYLASETPYRYCASDVRAAVAPHLERLRASKAAGRRSVI